MNLQSLFTTPNVSVYFDAANNWLFLEWEGDLTLARVQAACREIAQCYLIKSYDRILNSNLRVTSATTDITGWLASTFMPALDLAGVRQLAWVLAPTLCGRTVVLDTLARCQHMGINLFEDVEGAVSWLQQNRPYAAPGSSLGYLAPRPSAETRMREHFQRMTQQLASALRYPESGSFALGY